MRERPVLFSAEMVRSILEGRKTQTRRVVTARNSVMGSGRFDWCDLSEAFVDGISCDSWYLKAPTSFAPEEYCPECIVRIWPRIAPAHEWDQEPDPEMGYEPPASVLWVREAIDAREPIARYRSDGAPLAGGHTKLRAKIIPSIHMPRWACRLRLEVTRTRVERVQEITEADAEAEGVDHMPSAPAALTQKRGYGWDENPWVWVIEFRRLGGERLA